MHLIPETIILRQFYSHQIRHNLLILGIFKTNALVDPLKRRHCLAMAAYPYNSNVFLFGFLSCKQSLEMYCQSAFRRQLASFHEHQLFRVQCYTAIGKSCLMFPYMQYIWFILNDTICRHLKQGDKINGLMRAQLLPCSY